MGNFFLEKSRRDELMLLEKDGDFRDCGTRDLLIATFHDTTYAKQICDQLNEFYYSSIK